MLSPRGRRSLAALASLAVVAACATSGSSDDGEPSGPSTTSPTAAPTSTRPEFNPEFEDAGAPGPGDDASSPDGAKPGTCSDTNDVGGSESVAKALSNIDDCSGSGGGIGGVVNGPVDVDVYKFQGTDTFGIGCSVDPTLSSSSAGVELCMFASCLTGNIEFDGCTGGTQATSALGFPGCCISPTGGALTTTLSYNCAGTTSESATVYIRVSQKGAACLPYAATYSF